MPEVLQRELDAQLKQKKEKLVELNNLDIISYIANGKLEEAIAMMRKAYPKNWQLAEISGNLHDLQKQNRSGALSHENFIVNINKIRCAFSQFYKEFETDIENEIEHAKRIIEERKIQQKKINKKIDKKDITCFILISQHAKVAAHLSEVSKKWPGRIASNRYATSANHLFTEDESIEKILDSFKAKTGYGFESIKYLDGTLSQEQRLLLEKKRATIVLLVDPLSLCANNQLIAKIFDHKESGGIVIPICTTLLKKKSSKYIKQTIRVTFSQLHELRKVQPCPFYYPFLADRDCLEQSLRAIFELKFLANAENTVKKTPLDPNAHFH